MEKSIWDILNKKEIKCRYCHTLIDMENNGYNCPNEECGSAYKEQHWYAVFKREKNGIINLWDYFEFHIPEDIELEEAMKIADYELKNRD